MTIGTYHLINCMIILINTGRTILVFKSWQRKEFALGYTTNCNLFFFQVSDNWFINFHGTAFCDHDRKEQFSSLIERPFSSS